jgi:nucleotide-binding universal stress UspA family protein
MHEGQGSDQPADDPLAGLGPRASAADGPLKVHVIAVCAGDQFGAGAVHVAQFLARASPSASLSMLDGTVAPAVVGQRADRLAAVIIVLPAPNVGSNERLSYADRACRIAAATRHPVLLVPETPSWPPRRCLAAMDFSQGAIDAAIIALDLLSCPGHAAHVFVNAIVAPESRSDEGSIPRHIRLLFAALPTSARQRPSIAVTQHCLSGPRVPRLVDFAVSWGAELLSVGRQGHPRSTATTDGPIGPTVRGLLESAPCSLVLSGRA